MNVKACLANRVRFNHVHRHPVRGLVALASLHITGNWRGGAARIAYLIDSAADTGRAAIIGCRGQHIGTTKFLDQVFQIKAAQLDIVRAVIQ